MPANFKGGETLKQKEIKEPIQNEYSFAGLAEQTDSEIKWVKLHQMFDR